MEANKNTQDMANDFEALCVEVEDHYNADILIYFGLIARKWDDFLIDICKRRTKRKNVLLILTTYGGDPHAAYRMGRCLQSNYKKPNGNGEVTIYVPSFCASAGTLLTLAADKLILSDHAELGPLDIQLRKPDEVGERISGLTPIQALGYLESETAKFFKAQFKGLRHEGSGGFSTKMAAEVSAQLANGLLAKLYEQIDPLRLAEYDRANRIAEHYGARLQTKNVKPNSITRLLEDYPAHEFCIDPTEAKELFQNISQPDPKLDRIGEFLKPLAENVLNTQEPMVFYLTQPKTEPKPEPKNEEHPSPISADNGGNGKADGAAEPAHAKSAAPEPEPATAPGS